MIADAHQAGARRSHTGWELTGGPERSLSCHGVNFGVAGLALLLTSHVVATEHSCS